MEYIFNDCADNRHDYCQWTEYSNNREHRNNRYYRGRHAIYQILRLLCLSRILADGPCVIVIIFRIVYIFIIGFYRLLISVRLKSSVN